MIEQSVDFLRQAITPVWKEAVALTVTVILRRNLGVFILQVSEAYFYVDLSVIY